MNWNQFCNAVTVNSYATPTKSQYESFIKGLGPRSGITSKREAAMFLAQVLWESGGLVHKRELAFMNPPYSPNNYNSNASRGLYYYGRGYIQLVYI